MDIIVPGRSHNKACSIVFSILLAIHKKEP